jgi:hypothetical protein
MTQFESGDSQYRSTPMHRLALWPTRLLFFLYSCSSGLGPVDGKIIDAGDAAGAAELTRSQPTRDCAFLGVHSSDWHWRESHHQFENAHSLILNRQDRDQIPDCLPVTGVITFAIGVLTSTMMPPSPGCAT